MGAGTRDVLVLPGVLVGEQCPLEVARGGTGAGLSGDGAGLEGFAARGARHHGLDHMAARGVTKHERGSFRCGPLVAPLTHRGDDRPQVAAPIGEPVLKARRPVLVRDTVEDLDVHQLAQSVVQHVASDSESSLEVVETADAQERVTDDQQAPPLAHHLKTLGEATALTRVGERRLTGHIDEQWTSLQGVHGGVVAATAVSASTAAVQDAGAHPDTQLRAATFGYVSGNTVGDITIDVDIVRRGRNMITTHLRVSQGDKSTTVARLHHSTPWEGLSYSDAPPPVAMPGGAERIDVPGPAHLNNVETYLHPDTRVFAGADRSEWVAWSRPLDHDTFDAGWLTTYGDYFPPAEFARTTTPVRAVTIEYSIQIHSAAGQWSLSADEYLAARFHAFHSHDGFAVEDGWIHLPDGTLLATVRQSRLAG